MTKADAINLAEIFMRLSIRIHRAIAVMEVLAPDQDMSDWSMESLCADALKETGVNLNDVIQSLDF